jgi:general secretion pathway protein L
VGLSPSGKAEAETNKSFLLLFFKKEDFLSLSHAVLQSDRVKNKEAVERVLDEFLTWWGRQLWALVPQRLRQGTGAGNVLIADASDPGLITLTSRRRGSEGNLGQFRTDGAAPTGLRAALTSRPRGEPVLLRVAPGAAMERDVTLPLAAERDPERILGYEMERLTPFAADEVFWAYAIAARDRARGKLVLRLTIVPRTAVQNLIDLLADAGGRPALLEAPVAQGVRAITLSHEEASASRALLSARNGIAVAAGLVALILVSPFLHQSLDMADVSERLDTLAPQMSQVEALRRRITGAGSGGDAISTETRRLGDALEALAAVTEILPDDSYLTEFTMRERKMTLSGLSASAPRLISLLSADPRIRNPAFTAPVTRQEPVRIGQANQETAQRDVFSIRAELAP